MKSPGAVAVFAGLFISSIVLADTGKTGAARPLDDEALIKSVLQTQVEAWNRGDIPTFVTTYAENCTFVGKEVAQGRTQLLARYRKKYPTAAAMGHLTFSSLAVRLLDKDVAIVTAQWHLDRTGQGGGPVGGIFSLVLQRQRDGWKIALDHTS